MFRLVYPLDQKESGKNYWIQDAKMMPIPKR